MKGLFVERTIKHGAVRIGGLIFRPSERHLAYDGRLDDMRYMFGRYPTQDEWRPFVCLWGLRESTALEGPHVVNGTLPWYWWHTETI